MKKITAIILAVLIFTSVITPAAFAAKDGCSCGENPVIYVGPLGNTTIYQNPDTENEKVLFRPTTEAILKIVADILPSLVTLPVTRNYERFGDALIDTIYDSMGALALDGNGNSAENVSVKLELPTDPDHGMNKSYYFHYDWRLDPVEVAAQLDEFVAHVKQLTHHDKVNFRASSMGGVVTLAYFNEYGHDDVDACIFQSCPLLGTAVAGDLLARKLKLDGRALLDYGTGAYPPADAESTALYFLFNFLYYSGLVDIVLAAGDKILDELQTKVFDELMTPVFGTLLGLWSFVPDDTYEQAKKINLNPETQKGLIAKADYYHYNIQGKADKILQNAVRDDVRIMIVAGYDIQRTPLVETMTSDSDGTVDTKYASAGATVAERGETLAHGYKQKVDCGHNHISPDNHIDASTCILPEYTWFIKGMLHSNCHDGIMKMYNRFMFSDDYMNVYTDPLYTQFLQNDKPNKRVIPMGNFADGAQIPQFEQGDSFHDKYERYVAPTVNTVLSALDKVRDRLGLNK